MSVREDDIERRDGSTGIFGVVEKPDFALIVPRLDDGFVLVEQYRYPVSGRYWEFPQGSWSASSPGSQEELARTELTEETGYSANEVRHLGHLFEAYGFSNQGFDVYVANDLSPGAPAREVAEQGMKVGWFSRADVETMIRDGHIKDAPTIAAYGLLLLS